MTDQAKVARIARHIFEGHEQRRRFERLRGALAPASLGEAYDVQDEVHRLFRDAGWGELAGHKIALTSQGGAGAVRGRSAGRRRDLRAHHPRLAGDRAHGGLHAFRPGV